MQNKYRLLTVLFGPIGDAVITLAFFDDILTVCPDATLLILTRHNAKLIADLAAAYPNVQVRPIPAGWRSIPFFASLLIQRWTLLTLGVAGAYSMRLKLFFLALTLLGNRTLGFNDRLPGQKRWLPLNVALQFDGKLLIIDNFRRLLPYFLNNEAIRKINGRAPTVNLSTQLPKDFPYARGQYIVVHLFGSSIRDSLPPRRWKHILARIAHEYPAYKFVLTGAKKDQLSIDNIIGSIPGAFEMVNFPILEVASVIDGAALYLGVDTGITHVAGVLKQKSIIISHFGDPTWLPTYNPNARALANSIHCVCRQGGNCFITEEGMPYRRCMYDISDEAILGSVRLALSSTERSILGFAGFKDENQ